MSVESTPAGAPSEAALRLRVARLEGRVRALEDALERRSRALRLLQESLPPGALVQLDRISDGLPPLPRIAHQLEFWEESTEIVPADLEETLEDLWRSITPSPAAALLWEPAPAPWPTDPSGIQQIDRAGAAK